MKEDDDDRPKKKITHEIGQDLYLLSVKELEERIALMTEEIERLKASIASKQSSRGAADSIKPSGYRHDTVLARRDFTATSAAKPSPAAALLVT